MSDNFEKLKKVLAEIFQIDRADLDFGIYRIMNQKRDEIGLFLEKDLLPQVKEAFLRYKPADKAEIQKELDEAIQQAKNLGANPDDLPRVKELRAKLASSIDIKALEEEVFSHLTSFFRRYYDKGDFISQRRYKEGVYAIPYEGEEVKLYWANYDQYYTKSSETFRDYAFKIQSDKQVRIHLVAASTELDNNKAAPDKERRFVLCGDKPLVEENDELYIRFEYRPWEGKEKQDELNRQTIDTILKAAGFEEWAQELGKLVPTDKNKDRTVLEKHLTDYTTRNTSDYFIHKDLGRFLRRELDFYVKNEIMHLDDIENESAPQVEQYLSMIKVVRSIADKIISFLAQIEDFQKKLWLKKKFVVETNYCVTLDRVPEELYPEIATNDSQREEWIKLFAIDEIKGDLTETAYSVPLSTKFLKENPFLLVDTKFYGQKFKNRLLNSFENLDEEMDGVLVHSENYQALNLLQKKYRNKVKCIYIDPPYNTDASAILYKNNYKDSSWLSLIQDRVNIAKEFLERTGITCVAIDDQESSELKLLLSDIFEKEVGIVAVRSNPAGRKTKGQFAPAHEYALFYGKSVDSIPMSLDITEKRLSRYPHKDKHGNFAWANFIRSGSNDKRSDRPKLFYPIFVSNQNSIRIPEMEWDNNSGSYTILDPPTEYEEVIYPIMKGTNEVIEKNWQRGHERVRNELDEFRVRRSEDGKVSIDFKTRMDENSLPITWWDHNEYASANYGAAELKNLFGQKPFDFAKARRLVQDCIIASGVRQCPSFVLDFFAGSGTTGDVTINLNRENENNNRIRYILVEMGGYFNTVMKPRIQKVVYSKDWKDGKPISREGSSHMFKYLRLESYEDTLNNLELKRTKSQEMLISESPSFKESYVLSYMLDLESKESLLNISAFEDPFNYKLKIATDSVGETKHMVVDLVETFNYLIGLTVHHIDHVQGYRVIQGINPKGEKTLIIWRNTKEKTNDDLEKFFRKQDYNPKDMEFAVIYVNGDNNLENIKKDNETWKVRLIEEEFKRLMFDTDEI